jgi:hypothetical protein
MTPASVYMKKSISTKTENISKADINSVNKTDINCGTLHGLILFILKLSGVYRNTLKKKRKFQDILEIAAACFTVGIALKKYSMFSDVKEKRLDINIKQYLFSTVIKGSSNNYVLRSGPHGNRSSRTHCCSK